MAAEYGAAAQNETGLSQLLQRQIERDTAGGAHIGQKIAVIQANAIQHPFAHVENQVGFFGERNELRGRNIAVARQTPAQQGFSAYNLAGADVDFWLIPDNQFVALQCTAQFALHHQPLDRCSVHFRRVESESIATVLLGVVHRSVGIANQVDDVFGVAGTESDTDAAGQKHFLLIELKRLADFGEDRARQMRDRAAVVRIGRQTIDEHGKFVAGEPTDNGLFGHSPGQPLRQNLKRAIARGMAKGVVDLFKMVHVEVQQRHCRIAAVAARNALLQQMLKLHAIGDLGERVVTRQVTNAALGALALGDIARNKNTALKLRIVAGDLRAGQCHRNGLSLSRPHQRFAGFVGRLLQVKAGAFGLVENRRDAAADQFFFAIA